MADYELSSDEPRKKIFELISERLREEGRHASI